MVLLADYGRICREFIKIARRIGYRMKKYLHSFGMKVLTGSAKSVTI